MPIVRRQGARREPRVWPPRARYVEPAALVLCLWVVAQAQAQRLPSDEPAVAAELPTLETVVVTARLREEDAQSVPIAMTVVQGELIDKTFSNNIQQVSLMVPTINYNSPNPRNTALTIRGLGSSVVAIAQSNDGLDPGVGFYVDEVYHGRPATAAFDFMDIERIEVLRGPQGTLFGKNTTAGAIHITTEAPSFVTSAETELSGGNYGYYQGRAYATGALISDELAGRISGVVTGRNGVLDNVTVGDENNDLHNEALRGQLLFEPSRALRVRLSADYSAFNSNCCTQVYDTVGTTLKPASRQYPALAAGVGYAPPSLNPYDRLSDIDSPLKVATNEGGVGAIADWDLGPATLTSVSAWRYWNWDAANDRDYTSLPIQTQQHIPSRQDQYSEEVRLASTGKRTLDYTAGLYWFDQTLTGEPITVYGPLATYWLLGPSTTYPSSLLDGYGTDGHTRYHVDSYAAFGEINWHVTGRLAVTAGLRFTQEQKSGRYASSVFGGLATTDPTLLNAQLSILRPQAYTASVSNGSPSGRLSVSYAFADGYLAYATYANAQKSGGINMSGLPLNASNQPALGTAVILPEHDATAEIGLKTTLFAHHMTLDADLFDTRVHNYQANIVDNAPGALRGYLANIDEVTVRGAELDASLRAGKHFTAYAAAALTEAKYASYQDGPCPLELIGSATAVCDLSGRPLPATPHTAYSVGGEFVIPRRVARQHREWYLHADFGGRSQMYGDASDSKYTLLGSYALLNASVGERLSEHWDLAFWARNLLGRNYLQNVTVQAGNSGLVVGTPSDPRTWGVTWRLYW